MAFTLQFNSLESLKYLTFIITWVVQGHNPGALRSDNSGFILLCDIYLVSNVIIVCFLFLYKIYVTEWL